MTKIINILFICFAAVLTGCASTGGQTTNDAIDTQAMLRTDATKEQRQLLAGTWYRKQPTKDGGTSEELTKMNTDGSYLFQFRLSRSGQVTDTYFESGFWGVSGGYHFTFSLAEGHSRDRMHRANPEDHRNYWAYKVLELNESKFRYQTVATGNMFELHRVATDFELP